MTQPRLLGERYELDGVVGRGGMAEVYRARDIRLDRVVAIKTLRTDLARDQTFQARFRREAQSAASLNHPSIVAVYDTGEDMATGLPVPYIVMEYVDGRTVRDLLQDDHRLLPERALEIISGVLGALDYSHQSGIVHRDIKPGNVMVTRNGDIKVMDFGIARAMSDNQATMTQTAQVIGTAQYLSPEQARGERVDARSDLYSTGCLMYELLTGRPPFTGDSPVAIAYQHVRENPVPPSVVDPEIPPWADAIVLKAMAKDPADRYQGAAEMRMDVQRAMSGMPVAAPTRLDMYQGTQQMGAATMMASPTTAVPPYQYADEEMGGEPPRRGHRALLWILGLLVVLGAVGALAYLLLGGGGKTYAVPLVQGVPVAQAQQQVTAAHLKSTVVSQASSTIAKGDVINTNPAGGNTVPAGTLVTLYVSTGPQQVTVPDVTGQTATAAQNQLQGLGLTVTQKPDPGSTAPKGQVTRQTPAGQTKVSPGSAVTIYVSGGAVQVPSVVGDSAATAEQILQGAGFQVVPKTVAGPASATPGDVFQQTPAGQSSAAQGSTVTIYIAAQPAAPSPSPTPSATPSPTPSPTSSGLLPGGGGGGGGGNAVNRITG
ncbi:MAG TPA: Stk1 family PASTA domain-containing Ser/Thr kinase [Streptosporangiaceae bacterium]|jgi:serine/threonine-protein kinase|nr:Stk1 family PASTA domain-containing Ser/Thr kinase [Streptosporangiaceae bacterium]